jgi:hypothetical protein
MGRPGSFNNESLRLLIRKLAWAISNLPQINTVCTVLIGSGEGTLRVDEAVTGLIRGVTDALSGKTSQPGIHKLKVVECYRGRAEKIHHQIQQTLDQPWGQEIRKFIDFSLKPELTFGKEAKISPEDPLELLIDAAMGFSAAKGNTREGRAFKLLIENARVKGSPSSELRDILGDIASKRKRNELTPRIRLIKSRVASAQTSGSQAQIPTRISFFRDGENIRVAAISGTATVAERILRFDPSLVSEIVRDINTSRDTGVDDVSDFLSRLLMPRDFRDLFAGGGPFIFEVDRWMAQVHWEMLADNFDPSIKGHPLGISSQVARQLRTTYSPSPVGTGKRTDKIKALIIGDPGDPDRGMNLPGAMKEALAVKNILDMLSNKLQKMVDVEVLIGAPNIPRHGELRNIKPATRIKVLHRLMHGGYDILHYAGHADYNPVKPDRAGWLFSEGLLTASELERIDEAPCLVVANACLSGRLSHSIPGDVKAADQERSVNMLPSLVDEFFRRGVRNYIGTAWEVSDVGAILFAKTFYESLLKDTQGSIGQSVKHAREALYREKLIYGNLWGAYHHYGDPVSPLRLSGQLSTDV